MYKNKNGQRNNIAGVRIQEFRKQQQPKMSQNALAKQMQLIGIDLDKNAIQRIEAGSRFITDIELKAFAEIFETTSDQLLL
jgi:transcriptional regulator with XRE-family HTH domain